MPVHMGQNGALLIIQVQAAGLGVVQHGITEAFQQQRPLRLTPDDVHRQIQRHLNVADTWTCKSGVWPWTQFYNVFELTFMAIRIHNQA